MILIHRDTAEIFEFEFHDSYLDFHNPEAGFIISHPDQNYGSFFRQFDILGVL